MQKIKGYNRNIMGGKRPHKKLPRFGQFATLAERLKAETDALYKYRARVKNQK